MKQLLQNLKTGTTSLLEVPVPAPAPGQVLVRVTHSVLSPGTERMLLDFGKAGWMGKMRQQPERVNEVLNKVKTDGLLTTWDAVRSKLDKEIPLGNSATGIVVAVGSGVTDFAIGDRVACNGSHAEFVCVSKNLCVKVPESVPPTFAAFTVMGAIALQGIRLLQTNFGERVVVYGLGLIGQLAVQLLRASGCEVFGIDADKERCRLAQEAGAVVYCNSDSGSAAPWIAEQAGSVDAVLITASATNDQIIADAAHMCRKRGRIVLTGVVNTTISRNDFYKKELSFQVSSAYGPGRYDFDYEQGQVDYPEAYLRWTAARNMSAVVAAMASGTLNPSKFPLPEFPFEAFDSAYTALLSKEIPGAVFYFQEAAPIADSIQFPGRQAMAGKSIAVVGTGNFASRIVLPALIKAGARIAMLVSEQGVSAAQLARKFQVPEAASSIEPILKHSEVQSVLVLTPHESHARLVSEFLNAGKDVFVEKPLALNRTELDAVALARKQSGRSVQVGYNRRFAPLAVKAKSLLGAAPAQVLITVNAGKAADSGWLGNPEFSGGRLVGEVCHFIDLVSFFCDAPVAAVCASSSSMNTTTVTLLLRMGNGSSATIQYITEGHSAFPKERVELFGSGKVLVVDNWRRLRGYGASSSGLLPLRQDKGHKAQFDALVQLFKEGGKELIPFESLYNTSLTTFVALDSIREGTWKDVKF